MNQSSQNKTRKSASRKPKSKRNRVRTKTCAKCFTPCTTITRCKLGVNKSSTYICDICWPTYCEPDPGYRYEGTWQSGRIIDGDKASSCVVADSETDRPQPTEARSTPGSKRKPGFQKRGRGLRHRLVRRDGGGRGG